MSGQRAAIVVGATEPMPLANDIGCLTDVDPARELAQLTALRNRQLLEADASARPSATPLTLLSLFSHA